MLYQKYCVYNDSELPQDLYVDRNPHWNQELMANTITILLLSWISDIQS